MNYCAKEGKPVPRGNAQAGLYNHEGIIRSRQHLLSFPVLISCVFPALAFTSVRMKTCYREGTVAMVLVRDVMYLAFSSSVFSVGG